MINTRSAARLRTCGFGLIVALAVGPLIPRIHGQEQRRIAVQGYVTALNLPAGFDVNGMQVSMRADTGFGLQKDRIFRTDSPLRDELQIGAYVFVLGDYNDHKHTANATAVLFRNDWNQKIEGTGVIDKVITSGSEPVFRADGYFVRVTTGTEKTFKGTLNSLDDVGTNAWIVFEGKRDGSGMVVASTATFLPPKPTKFKALKGVEVEPVEMKPAGAPKGTAPDSAMGTISSAGDGVDLTEDKELKTGWWQHWHTLPADQPLQQRVHRIGMSLVPEYQRAMADDDPSKIHFRFYAVDYKGMHSEVCLLDGVILVPRQMIERMTNDDELAAILADGVAYNLQRQAAQTVVEVRKALALEAIENVALYTFPPVGVGILVGSLAQENPMVLMQEERARVSLGLMQDAGYDPWQAPEAWRLMAPKNPPKDPTTLRYPDISGYQLGILNLQYRKQVHTAMSTR